MEFQELIEQARDTLTVKRVFGEPYQEDGVTVIPAARIRGGMGGGSGADPKGQQGTGGGFGVIATPAGAYVISHGEVTWRPAIDVGRVVLGCQVVALAALLVVRTIVKARSTAR